MNNPTPRKSSGREYTSENQSDLRLTSRYRWLLMAVILPLFIVIMLLAANQYRDLRRQIFNGLAQDAASHSIAIEGIAKLAGDHVLQMQAWSENYLRSPPSYPSDLRTYYTPRFVNGTIDGYTLDKVPEEKRNSIGQLVWLGGDPRQPEVGEVALDQALEFFALARLTHDVTPYFQWSYFFSAGNGFIALYPWQSVDDLMGVGDYASLKTMLDGWFQYEIYLAGTPSKNPRRRPYWTTPYIDAAGTGAMVAHGAPVYVEGKFLGIVGTDLRLVTLERFLMSLPIDVGRLMILDDQHRLLADTAGSPRDAIREATEVASGVLTDERLSTALSDRGKPLQAGPYHLVAHEATHAPWTLVYLVSDREIMGLLLPRLLPYAVILIVLVATIIIALYLLRREFISPALALVHYIRDASGDPAAAEPQLPRLWQTWVDVVSRTFTETRDATHRVQESEERLQQILNNSSAVVSVRDREERFILINQRFERLLGVTPGEIIGKHLNEVFPPETATELRSNDQRIFEHASVMEFEEEMTLDDGLHTYISSRFPLFDTEGNISAVCSISTDITKRKQSEEVLHQAALGISAARGEEVFDSLALYLSKAIGTDYALIAILDGADSIRTKALCVRGSIEANITYSLADSPSAQVVGQQFRYYPNRIRQGFPDDRLLQEMGVESYAAIPLFDTAGGALGLLAVLDSQPLKNKARTESILQIFAGHAASELERERADAMLRASEEQYRSIFNAASDALILWDAHGRMVDANPAAWKMGGYTREEFFKKPFEQHIHPSSHAAYEKFKSEVATVRTASTEIKAMRKDDSILDLESRSIAMPYQGRPHILTITRDITEQKRMTEELARQRDTLRQSEKLSAMGGLLAGVAHELNNPLAILMGRAALLEEKVKDSAFRPELEKIRAAADRCGRIVRTFLDMARQKEPTRRFANLNDVVTGAIELLGYSLRTSGIEVESRLDAALPGLSMDANQVGQVVVNLLVNAQHVLSGQAQPRHILVETGHLDTGVYCRVSDNGPGVPAELRERIFDPFFTTKEDNAGTGVGLSVSRGIAREHGGELRLEETNNGAALTLWIPLEPASRNTVSQHNAAVVDELQAGHALIVDDEPEIVDLLAEILQSAGLTVTRTRSGEEAIGWLEHHDCDYILSDIRMPDMDGPALWRTLKARHPEFAARLAFITGDTLSASIAPFLRETGRPWLEKPFTPEQVLALIARIESGLREP